MFSMSAIARRRLAVWRRPAVAIAGVTLGVVSHTASLSAQGSFPAAWAGQWRGTLTTYVPPDSVRNRIPISLLIAPDPADSRAYLWRTIFNADTVRGNRPYRLLIDNAAQGRYATDESNGVLLEDTWIGGVLTSVFQVQTRVLQSRYELRGDTLTHELTWWDATPSRTVKGAGANAEGGATITSHRVQGMQRAVMVRSPT
jgi:hypothetical protein